MSEYKHAWQETRDALPEAAKTLTQFAVDNPGFMIGSLAAILVLGSAARNIVRPKTVAEVMALELVLNMAWPVLARYAVESGLLRINLRDKDGKVIPFDPKQKNLKAVKSS